MKNECHKPSAGYLKLKRELANGNTKKMGDVILREFFRMKKDGKKPRVDHRSYGAAVSWLLKAFPLGEYDCERGEFKRELEIYHPVIKELAKHDIIATCAENAFEGIALKKLFNRAYAAINLPKNERDVTWNAAVNEFVKKVGLERSKVIFSTPVKKTFKADLIEKLGDKRLLSKKALRLGRKYGLKQEKSYVRHLYAQGMTVLYGFFKLLAKTFDQLQENK